jgi:hypothetical protein
MLFCLDHLVLWCPLIFYAQGKGFTQFACLTHPSPSPAAKYPMIPRTAPNTRNYPVQNVSSAEIEKPCPEVLEEVYPLEGKDTGTIKGKHNNIHYNSQCSLNHYCCTWVTSFRC